jgi:hypothetical protein
MCAASHLHQHRRVLTAPGTRQAPTSAPERQRVLSLQAVDAAGRPQVVEYAAGQAELPVPMPEPTATLLKTRLESLGYRTHVYVPQGGIGSVISIRHQHPSTGRARPRCE